MSDDLVKRARRFAADMREHMGPPEMCPSPTGDDMEDIADALESQSAELARLRERNAELEEELDAWRMDGSSAADRVASLEATVRGLREALKPFSDAADKAQISGSPVFYFVGAPDYERARTILKSIGDD